MFNSLIGNQNVKNTLRHLISKGRVPNSLLFAGDVGVGKRQFALELARSFICTDKNEGEACGVCTICRRSAVFTFPKVDDKEAHRRVIFSEHADIGTVIAYNRNILVDAIRHLESEANFRPYEAAARFFIIDDADKMNEAASNALLKTLEEPYDSTYIFLITSRPDSLLPTIRSRCQTIRFAPIEIAEVERFMIEDRAFTHDEARLAARLSRGSIGRAMSINVEQFKKDRSLMLSAVTAAIVSGNTAEMLRVGEEMNSPKRKDDFEPNLDIMQSLIHDIWSLSKGSVNEIVNTDLSDRLAELASQVSAEKLASWIAKIDELRSSLAVNVNRKIAADALFVGMSR